MAGAINSYWDRLIRQRSLAPGEQMRLTHHGARLTLAALDDAALEPRAQLWELSQALKSLDLTAGARRILEQAIVERADAARAALLIFDSRFGAAQREGSAWGGRVSKAEARRALDALDLPALDADRALQAILNALRSTRLTAGGRELLEDAVRARVEPTAAAQLIYQCRIDVARAPDSASRARITRHEADWALKVLEETPGDPEIRAALARDTMQEADLTAGGWAELRNFADAQQSAGSLRQSGGSPLAVRLGTVQPTRPQPMQVKWELGVPLEVIALAESAARSHPDMPYLNVVDSPALRWVDTSDIQKFRQLAPDLKQFIDRGSSSLSAAQMKTLCRALALSTPADDSCAAFRPGDRVEFSRGGEPHRGLVTSARGERHVQILATDGDGTFRIFDSERDVVLDLKVLAAAARD